MAEDERQRSVPIWAWLCALPCAAVALLGIDRGALGPPGPDPVADGLRAMAGVTLTSTAAFGCLLWGRAARPLWARALGCLGLVAAALWLGSVTGVAVALPARWRAVNPEGAAFAIELPGKPEPGARRLPGPAGEAEVREWTVRSRGLIFTVQERDLPPGRAEAPEALLDRARDEAALAGRARVLSERALTLATPAGPLPGRELSLRADGRLYRARLFARPPLLWVLLAGPLESDEGEIDRFFNSFSVR